MSLNRCPFCKHENPADSKFCNGCGAPLHLVPCPHCGVVNDVTQVTCYECRSPLQQPAGEGPDAAPTAAAIALSLPRRNSRVLAGVAVLSAIAVLGYYGYREFSLADAPRPPAASSDAGGRGGAASAGTIVRDTTTSDAAPAKMDDSARPAGTATSPPETPLAGPTRAAAVEPRVEPRAAESRETKHAAGPIVRPATGAGKAGGKEPPLREACTEALAALGLCVSKPAAGPAARVQATDAGKAGAREPPRQEACTEAVAALGLCVPRPTQRRE
jgi:hypothetical protein